MKIKVVIEKGEDGYFVARCPSLKSCWSQGKTEEEALKNIREAIELYLEPDEELVEDKRHKVYEVAV
jgi:predicted RNase H-like HicB family nuclease